MEKIKARRKKIMDFKEVPKGRVIPFYLTDEGDIYP